MKKQPRTRVFYQVNPETKQYFFSTEEFQNEKPVGFIPCVVADRKSAKFIKERLVKEFELAEFSEILNPVESLQG